MKVTVWCINSLSLFVCTLDFKDQRGVIKLQHWGKAYSAYYTHVKAVVMFGCPLCCLPLYHYCPVWQPVGGLRWQLWGLFV